MIRLTPSPLTAVDFAPFGTVLQNDGPERRVYVEAPFEAEPPARPCLWISQGGPVVSLPLRVALMERHPWSAQSFVPLTPARFLVVVAGDTADGTPDLATMRAFVAQGVGICYRRNVWHMGMSALDPGARFVTMMATSGHADDDVFLDLAAAVEIAA
jgi:ureidoglycolate lyase